MNRPAMAPGARIGPYEILSLLGAGGMGEVYRARDAKLDRDVTIKILPPAFASDGERSATDLMNSPTITSPATQVGTILGTAAYMAPEQAKGRAVDRRADIWAFGVILYEMLTGRACFHGDTVSEVMASVMKDTPDFAAPPPRTPPPLVRLLARCLEKDPRRRLSAIGDARWDLEESAHPEAALSASASAWPPWIAAAIAAVAVVVAGWTLMNRPVDGAHGIAGRFTVDLPADAPLVIDDQPRPDDLPVAISQDGRHIVYVAPQGAGTPVAVLDGVQDRRFDIARDVLVYAPAAATEPAYSLVWVDRKGNATPINDLPRGYEDLHLSPDGRRVAATLEEPGPDSPAHVWLADTIGRTLTRFTFEGFSRDPVWAPDGQSIVYGSKRGDLFGLYVQRLDGRSPAELVYQSTNGLWPDPQSWSPDGKTIVFNEKDPASGNDIWTVAIDTRAARPWLATPASENNGRLSPDGRWMAYHSNASGREEVYVQPYPGPGAKHLVSQGGGLNPIWSRDGREIFYRRDADLMVVTVDASAGFTAGSPAAMFAGRYRLTGRDFDVSPDGTRFVMMRADEPRTGNRLRVLVDWRRLLEPRLKGMR